MPHAGNTAPNVPRTERGLAARARSWVLLGALALGCEVDQGFMSFGEEFFDPAVQYFNVPGTRIADGLYADLRVQVATDGRRYVAALRDWKELTFSFFDETPQCSVGEVTEFSNAVPPFAEGDDGDELLAFVTRDPETLVETLRFTNRDCEEVGVPIENARLPRAVLDDAGPDESRGFLVHTNDNRLILADPWHEVNHELGVGVSRLRLEPEQLFTIEEGELVVRDRKLTELGRLGSAVQHFELGPSRMGPPLLDIAYSEGSELYVASVDDLENPRRLEEDACAYQFGLRGEETRLSYLSPCATGRLVIADSAGKKRREYAEGVTWFPEYELDDDVLRVAYVTGAEPGAADGPLWFAVGEEDPIQIHENANLTSLSFVGEDLYFLTDFDGSVGTYVRWKDGEIETLAERVAEASPTEVLANFDGNTGDLLFLSSDGEAEEVASGVPVRARRGDAFIANFNGVVGDLMWLEDGQPPAIEIGKDVGKSAFGFGVQFEAIIYLKDRDPENGTSTLTIRLIESGDVFEITNGVSESREVAYPRPGILYSVLAGEEPGIWFAHAR